MKVTLKIKRFNPEKDSQPWWGEYQFEAEPTDRLLDALNHVKWYVDGTLTFRRSCAHGICGSDAMLINGANALACKVLLKNLGSKITVEPMRGFKVIKDLLVDMEAFFEKYKKVKPYLITHSPEPEEERLQSIEDREVFEDTTSASSAALVRRLARRSGRTRITSGPPPSSTPIALSSTAAMKAPASAWKFLAPPTASGAAAPSSTAWKPARAASTSPAPSGK